MTKNLLLLITTFLTSIISFAQAPSSSAVLSGDTTIFFNPNPSTCPIYAILSVAVTGGVSPYTVTITDGSNNYTVIDQSPVIISVSPTLTKTYTIVSVIDANVDIIAGNSGSATVTRDSISSVLAFYQDTVFDP